MKEVVISWVTEGEEVSWFRSETSQWTYKRSLYLETERESENEVKYLPKLWAERIRWISCSGGCTCSISRICVCWRCRIGGNYRRSSCGRVRGVTLNSVHLAIRSVWSQTLGGCHEGETWKKRWWKKEEREEIINGNWLTKTGQW